MASEPAKQLVKIAKLSWRESASMDKARNEVAEEPCRGWEEMWRDGSGNGCEIMQLLLGRTHTQLSACWRWRKKKMLEWVPLSPSTSRLLAWLPAYGQIEWERRIVNITNTTTLRKRRCALRLCIMHKRMYFFYEESLWPVCGSHAMSKLKQGQKTQRHEAKSVDISP